MLFVYVPDKNNTNAREMEREKGNKMDDGCVWQKSVKTFGNADAG